MKAIHKTAAGACLLALPLMLGVFASRQVEAQQKPAPKAAGAPTFKIDPTWPLEFPNHWVMGSVTGVFVDSKDHTWITQPARDAHRRRALRGTDPADGHLLQGGAGRHRARPERQGRAGLGRQGQGGAGEVAAQSARHLRRSQRLRLGRHAHAPPRDEVHARRQAGDDDRRVRQERRQQRHQAARRPVGHLGRSEDQRGVHLRRLPQPPRHRVRRRDRRPTSGTGARTARCRTTPRSSTRRR